MIFFYKGDLETNSLKLSGYRDGKVYVVDLAKLSLVETVCFFAKAFVDVSLLKNISMLVSKDLVTTTKTLFHKRKFL